MIAAETIQSYERHKKVEEKRATENAIQKVANIIADSET